MDITDEQKKVKKPYIDFYATKENDMVTLKVVTSEKIGGSGVISTLGTWYGGVVMGVLLPFNEAAILYRDFNSARHKSKI
jgi:hypothetical protein